MRKFVATAISAGAAIGVVLTPISASAATAHVAALAAGGTSTTTKPEALPTSGATGLTFSVTSGELSISVPGTANLGTGVPGSGAGGGPGSPDVPNISGLLGTVTVTDNRALDPEDWVVTAAETNFSDGIGNTIPATDSTYDPGTFTQVSGASTTTDASTPPITLTNAGVPVVDNAGAADNVVSWDPTIAITLPDDTIDGTYTGTLTQSVA
jgi:hypothetical protein